MTKNFNVNSLISFFKKNQKTILIGVVFLVALFFFGFFDKIKGSLSCGHNLVEGLGSCFGHPNHRGSHMRHFTRLCGEKTNKEDCIGTRYPDHFPEDGTSLQNLVGGYLSRLTDEDPPANPVCSWSGAHKSSEGSSTERSKIYSRHKCKLAYDNITNTNTHPKTRNDFCERIGLIYNASGENAGTFSNGTPHREYKHCYHNYDDTEIRKIQNSCRFAKDEISQEKIEKSIPKGCSDSDTHCNIWKRMGYCKDRRYRDYMSDNCPISCRTCPGN